MLNKSTSTPLLAAADLGYGWTKIAAKGTIWRQPAVVGEPRQLRDEDIRNTDVRYFNKVNGEYKLKHFIGDLAVRHSRIRYTSTGQDRAKSWITTVLLETGLGVIVGGKNVNLVTGLPVDFYFKQKADFELMLKGFNECTTFQLQEGKAGRVMARPWVNDFHIVPQPLGAFMNHHANNDGSLVDADAARKLWLVLDFGFYTFDMLVLEGLETKPGSGSPAGLGISEAYKLIQDELKGKMGQVPDVYTLDQYILKGMDYDGFDLQPLKDWAFDAIASQAQNEIDGLNRRPYGVILTGGWAAEMAPRLQLPANTVVMNQLGNIEGYNKIARRKWRAV